MQYRFRRIELIPTLFMASAVILMFSPLGVWQLHRLQWKNALIADIETAQMQAPKNLLSYPVSELEAAQWHNVIATGHFLHENELYATPRYLHEQMGYAVLTPLMIDTPKGKQYVLVNRGWVAPLEKDPKSRASGNPTGLVTVEGVIRKPLPQGTFRPDNRPDKNLWFWYDLPAMAQHMNLPLLPIYIDATAVRPAGGGTLKDGPAPFPVEITLRNDHLGYAITWFLIGIAGLVMYVLYYLEKKD